MKMTFQEYDQMVERFEQMGTKVSWPDLDDVEECLEQNPDKYIAFACFIYEKAPDPKTKDEEYRKKTLGQFIQNNLELYEKL